MSHFSETVNAGLSVNSFFAQPVSLRVIPFQTYSGALNMALDTWFAGHHDAREGILRFYGWRPYCLSIGYHQDISIIDQDKTSLEHVDVVRRPTGGRAIYHAEELTYSIVFSKSVIGHRDLYTFMHRIIACALRKLGYMVELTNGGPPLPVIRQTASDFACFTRSAQSEIQYQGRKVVGSAQKIYPRSILQHGSIIIGRKHLDLIQFLRAAPDEKVKIDNELRQRTRALCEIRESVIKEVEIMDAVIRQLESSQNLSIYLQDLTQSEIKQVQ